MRHHRFSGAPPNPDYYVATPAACMPMSGNKNVYVDPNTPGLSGSPIYFEVPYVGIYSVSTGSSTSDYNSAVADADGVIVTNFHYSNSDYNAICDRFLYVYLNILSDGVTPCLIGYSTVRAALVRVYPYPDTDTDYLSDIFGDPVTLSTFATDGWVYSGYLESPYSTVKLWCIRGDASHDWPLFSETPLYPYKNGSPSSYDLSVGDSYLYTHNYEMPALYGLYVSRSVLSVAGPPNRYNNYRLASNTTNANWAHVKEERCGNWLVLDPFMPGSNYCECTSSTSYGTPVTRFVIFRPGYTPNTANGAASVDLTL